MTTPVYAFAKSPIFAPIDAWNASVEWGGRESEDRPGAYYTGFVNCTHQHTTRLAVERCTRSIAAAIRRRDFDRLEALRCEGIEPLRYGT